jgi:hypothetical protein
LLGLARVQTMYSFCHALALYDTLRWRTDAWVATGTKGSSRTSERVLRLLRRWCIGVQVALWSAIAWFVPVHGLSSWWLMVAFTLLNLYVVYPLVRADADLPTVGDLTHRAQQALQEARAAHPGARSAVVARALARIGARGLVAALPDPMAPRAVPGVLGALQSVGGSAERAPRR